MNSHQVIHILSQENHEVKMKYNELLQNHQDLKKEMDLVKLPQVSLPQVESQVSPIQHEQYKNTIRFLQAKNAELSRVITTKPVKSSTKVVPRGSKQSFKIMADKHPMTDGSHNVLHLFSFKTPTKWADLSEEGDADFALKMRNGVSSESTDASNNSSTNISNNSSNNSSNNPVKSRHFNPGFGYHYPGYIGYPGYLDRYGYGYPGYLGYPGYHGYGHHYLGGYGSD